MVRTLTPSISLQDLRLHAEAQVQEAKHVLAQLKLWLVEVWADFEQITVKQQQTSEGNDFGPVLRLKNSTLT